MYLALIALSTVLQDGAKGYLSGRVDVGDSLLFSAGSFFVAAVLFGAAHLLTARSRPAAARRAPGERRAVLRLCAAMNVLTAVCFLSVYTALTWIPAALTNGVTAAVGPLVVACAGLRGRTRPAAATWAFAGALLAAGLVLAVRMGGGPGGLTGPGSRYGLLLAAVAGVAVALLAVVSRRLADLGVGTTQVMAVRFHLTYVLAAALIALRGGPGAGWTADLPRLALLGVVAVVLPLYLLQIGLQRTDPLPAVVVLATSPAVAYAAQVAFGAAFDAVTAVLIGVLIALAAAGSAHGARAARSRRAAAPAPGDAPRPPGPAPAERPARALTGRSAGSSR
ncbi:hypothetical protein V1J52_03855 [Streptomyces sp. TRM 70351]|uniref:EamA family transporter n=1 Tax=Streptomyces sp. TRM 70351 TaxID=3116552 RepID=UPI002E7C2645|nr:hypothetical protein [Streptomyces sp. TRM 70351]MEE1927323.1 hypothetical protein [Streptomyces sp. TRM 70351]